MKKENFISTLKNEGKFYNLKEFAQSYGKDLSTLPYSIRILLENILRKASSDEELEKNANKIFNWKDNAGDDIAFYPARILLQDYTGVPCVVDIASMRDAAKELGLNPEDINPEIPVDLVIDHSVQVDQAGNPAAMAYNIKKEFERNSERYELLKWAQKSFTNFRAIPPDTGIIHQINIEYLSPVVQYNEKENTYYPDSVFGTDSHTTMINGLGVLGWGVGGIEAEACMLGEPSVFSIPQVIGVRFINQLPSGIVATDLALKVTQVLRERNVVGKFIEYFGPGYETLPLPDRATISNMAPEYGSTCGFFPVDAETINYLHLTGRKEDDIANIEDYMHENHLFYNADEESNIEYTEVIEIDLAKITTNLAGPKRPQDMVELSHLSSEFEKTITAPLGNHGFGLTETEFDKVIPIELDGQKDELKTGDVLIAAITSCTNTSNPSVLIGAGLLAKKAVELGLTIDPKVKTSFAPGSQAVTRYLEEAGLSPYLDKLGFNIIAYGCTTCIGNSGPLEATIEQAIIDNDLVAGAVLSGNRNFESRVHPLIKANYLASPILVIAYALAGNLRMNLQTDVIGKSSDRKDIYLKDIWPTSDEINDYVSKFVTSENYRKSYENIFSGTEEWNNLEVVDSPTFPWNPESTYIANPPYFDDQVKGIVELPKLESLRALAKLGDSVTTDHISPAGSIAIKSPAGEYLKEHGVAPKDFNSYGSRRGNHHVMTRGTLANTRLHNDLADGKEGSWTDYFPTEEIISIFNASEKYLADKQELVILAGKDYGMGSSRDWAAKGVKLLGVKAVIVESYERIHRSNLVMMGVVPLEYIDGQTADSLGLTGKENFEILLGDNPTPKQIVKVIARREDGTTIEFDTLSRFDSETEIKFYHDGGILNTVLDEKVRQYK
ncbi:aconitate hydratase 1 [Floricoccus tropicus]|uniref:Aconitate hydratase n=1 Tax=Floricoccus tropicus TaxID=1859473 RepID=A0A1E8GN91_9LACT|nr:aconitate hydratase AcnA [Floricoccus tropicus]OFI49702.1 aconitate hydratase 1 [Floricoccus tropicus]